MGSIGEKLDLESDEEIPFSSSQPTNKIDSLHCEAPHIATPRRSRVLRKMYQISLLRSIYVVILRAKINVLLPFGPIAIILHHVTGKHAWVFFFSLLGITPLAERLGYATEQLAFYTGPTDAQHIMKIRMPAWKYTFMLVISMVLQPDKVCLSIN